MEVAKGLTGVVVDETRICKIDKAQNRLYYFGYEIRDLAAHAAFETVFYLLTHGEVPDPMETTAFRQSMAIGRVLPKPIKSLLEEIPGTTNPLDVLRTGCSFLGTLRPEDKDNILEVAVPFSNIFCSMLFYWWHFHRSGVRIHTETGEETVAGHLLHLMADRPSDDLQRRAIDVSLIVYAEHDFNASTYAARIAASTHSDIYSCVTNAIGTLRGPIHGGANARVMQMFDCYRSVEDAEAGVLEMLAQKKRIFGFGQRAYELADPRNSINKQWARNLTEASDDTTLFQIAERIENVMAREKKMFANLDYYTAVIYRECGLPTELFPSMFLIARVPGLIAHVMEQRANNKLIHPSSKYVGADPRAFPGQLRATSLASGSRKGGGA